MVRNADDICVYNEYGQFLNDKGDVVNESEEDSSDSVHLECWKINGCSFEGVISINGEQSAHKYQYQFWDWEQMYKDGNDWLVEDPTISKKNRERICNFLNK